MEFDQLQKIWDSQNKQPMYAINEAALHQRILAKKHQANKITHISEWMIIVAHSLTGLFTLWFNQGNVFLYVLAAWMLISALYVVVNRIRRILATQRYDRSLLGDLQYALAVATYQVRLSGIMRWNIVPVTALIVLSFWHGEQSIWIIIAATLFFILVFFASKWEHNIYKTKKQDLEILLKKLTNG